MITDATAWQVWSLWQRFPILREARVNCGPFSGLFSFTSFFVVCIAYGQPDVIMR